MRLVLLCYTNETNTREITLGRELLQTPNVAFTFNNINTETVPHTWPQICVLSTLNSFLTITPYLHNLADGDGV